MVMGEWNRELALGFTNPVGTWRVLDVCLCCGGVCGEWVVAWTRVSRGGVLSVCAVSPDYMRIWQVQVSVFFSWGIHAHHMFT